MKITILGAGNFGTALSKILEENLHSVSFYDPPKFPHVKLENVVKDADALVLAVPSEFAPELLEKLPAEKPLICASKGFFSLTPFEKFRDFSVLSGASFADDLAAKKPLALTATSPFAAKLFKTKWLKIEQTADVRGVLLCGALKNIYAVGAGLKDLKNGTPEFETYLKETLKELRAILAANNCDPATAELSCGQDDLRLTCGSENSRNFRFGKALKAALETPGALETPETLKKPEETVEGLSAIKRLSELSLPSELDRLSEIREKVENAELR